MGVILDPHARKRLLSFLADYASRDPKAVYDRIMWTAVPGDRVEATAAFLFLQRLAFSGKAVGSVVVEGSEERLWRSPGFNRTSAYGISATEHFGAVRPMVPSLIRILQSYDRLASVAVDAESCPAREPTQVTEPTLVYIDPTYQDTTGYPNGHMPREEVLRLASNWHECGATVLVSEKEPLELPGWTHTRISSGRKDTSLFRGKQQEWVTSCAVRRDYSRSRMSSSAN
jgi:hypothetical protein